MYIFSSAIAAILPMLLYLYLVWRFDRYEREPVSLVIRNYLWGGVGAIVFAIIGSDLLYLVVSVFITDELVLKNVQTIVIAPVVEEFTKGFFLLLTVNSRKFDNITDGMVYGGAIGLGFGMTENFLYFVTYGDTFQNWITLVVIRTLFSAVMHGVSTATLGAFLGYAKFKGMWFKVTAAAAGFAVAIFIHFMWNLSVSFESTAILGFVFLGVSVIIMLIAFSLSVSGEKKIIYNELYEEMLSGLIPASHLAILYSSKRNKLGWINEGIRRLYINSATTLAFRKLQYKNSRGDQKTAYEQEIDYYRSYIKFLLADSGLDNI